MELLKGLNIIDFTHAYAGPFATMNLADFGANVIKIEKYATGDQSRSWGPMQGEKSAYYSSFNRGKKSISLNLAAPEAKQIVMELVKDADMVFENFKAGSIDRLGLGYADMKKVNPNIIFVSNSGYGTEGPYKDDACYDIIAQAMSGVIAATGYKGAVPSKIGPSIGDNYSGLMMVQGALLAYYNKLKTGKGQKVEISMYDCLFSMLDQKIFETNNADVDNKTGNTSTMVAPTNIYKTKDAYAYFSVDTDVAFVAFAEQIGVDVSKFQTNAKRLANFDELDGVLCAFFADKTIEELQSYMEGCFFTKVFDLKDVTECAQLQERKMIVPMEECCIPDVNMAGNPMKLSATPPVISGYAPKIGEHTEEILRGIGYTPEQIGAFVADKIVYSE